MGAPIYRSWGQRLLSAFSRTKTPFGYASKHNVNQIDNLRDDMPSFFIAETVKYLFLIFADDDVLPLHDVVLNTEAHPLPKISTSGFPWMCATRLAPVAEDALEAAEESLPASDATAVEQPSSSEQVAALEVEVRTLKAELAQCRKVQPRGARDQLGDPEAQQR